MNKKVCLDRRWKEVIFAGSGFGPNLLMVLMMAYFTDAVIPTGLNADIGFWSYCGAPIVSVIVFPILWTIGRFFDGVVDVPLAAWTDSLKNRKGGRFITILISFLPMVISFVLAWIPVFGMSNDLQLGAQIGNTIWIFCWSIVFFASYTLALITFYGSLSEVCTNQTQRARVSAYKSVFDTISYALVYAAIPALFKMWDIPIWKVALYLSPLMLTILIPYLFRKANHADEEKKDESVNIGVSIALTVRSKPFMKWLLVNCVTFFGLQMFLVSQNTLISGIMNLGAGYAALLNTCAFAPVPLMLYFFNRVRKTKGLRFVYQTCLLAFGISIFSFLLGSQYFWGDNIAAKLVIGAIGSLIGSWGIGAFFMMPYLIPTIIAAVEEEVTHKNHSAMYFAVQALSTSIVGAIASSLIYNYLKLWTASGTSGGAAFEWKCGVSIVPFLVAVFCIVGFFLCFLMPKNYSAKVIYGDLKSSAEHRISALENKKRREQEAKTKKIAEIQRSTVPENEKLVLVQDLENRYLLKAAKIDLGISKQREIVNYHFDESTSSANEESNYIVEKSSYFADVCLYLLSLGVFGPIHYYTKLVQAKKVGVTFSQGFVVLYILAGFVPFLSLYTDYVYAKTMSEALQKPLKTGVKLAVWISAIFLPGFFNVVTMVVKDVLVNQKIDQNQKKETE